MEESQGQPVIREGTPPTPESPGPSNQIVTEYPDGTIRIQTPLPTVQVLDEYEEAIATWPDDAGLRLHYSMVLQQAKLSKAARKQIEEAIRLRREWMFPHSQLAALLNEEGLYERALAAYQVAVQLLLQEQGFQAGHGEAILRWCIADQLKRLGRIDEAREELLLAVVIEQSAIDKGQGSEQLLQQLKDTLAEIDTAPS
jgi:tetratricopeptide (TPR) repeat protein